MDVFVSNYNEPYLYSSIVNVAFCFSWSIKCVKNTVNLLNEKSLLKFPLVPTECSKGWVKVERNTLLRQMHKQHYNRKIAWEWFMVICIRCNVEFILRRTLIVLVILISLKSVEISLTVRETRKFYDYFYTEDGENYHVRLW